MTAREKKLAHKAAVAESKRNIIQQFLQKYHFQTAEDIQNCNERFILPQKKQ